MPQSHIRLMFIPAVAEYESNLESWQEIPANDIQNLNWLILFEKMKPCLQGLCTRNRLVESMSGVLGLRNSDCRFLLACELS